MEKIVKKVPRIEWIDSAKGIGIILVVYGHVLRGLHSAHIIGDTNWFTLGDKFIYAFHMPLFFILSGLFLRQGLNKNGACNLLKNKISTILYPYILWSILHTTIEVILANFTNGQIEIQEIFTAPFIPRAHFWFLFALFFIHLINIGLYLLFEKRWLVCSLVIGVICYFSSINFLLFNPTLRYLLYFNIGVLLSNVLFYSKTSEILSKNIVLIFSLTSFSIVQYFFLFTNIDSYKLLAFLVAILGSFFCFNLSFLFDKYNSSITNTLKLLGRNSMYIYIMHILVTAGVRIILVRIFNIDNVFVHILLGVLLGIGIPYIIALKFKGNKIFDFLFQWKINKTQ